MSLSQLVRGARAGARRRTVGGGGGTVIPGAAVANFLMNNGQTTVTATLSGTIPMAAQAGHVALVTIQTGTVVTVSTAPTDWVLVSGPNTDSTGNSWVYGKVLVAGDIGAAVSWTFSASGRLSGHGAIYSGVSLTSRIVGTPLIDSATTVASAAIPTVAAVPEGSIVHVSWARVKANPGSDVTLPATYSQAASERASTAFAAGVDSSTESAYKVAASTGSYGGETASFVGNSRGTSYTIALPPTGTGGGGGTPPPPVVPAITFPSDANIINVKTAFGAVGNGIADDTAAIQAAVDFWGWRETANQRAGHNGRLSPRTLYFPAGTYRMTNSVIVTGSSLRWIGAGRGKTILKLDNNAAGYGSAGTLKYLIRTGNALTTNLANSGFGNFIQHMTINTGTGNPGAVAVRFDAANMGSLEYVDILGSGARGLAFETAAGPAQCRSVSIDGFAVGIYGDAVMMNNLTFYDILIKNATTAVWNDSKNFAFEKLVTENCGTAIRTIQDEATTIVVDSQLDGNGTGPAINLATGCFMYGRDIIASGFSNIVTEGGAARFVGASFLREWSTHNYRRGNTSVAWTENNAYVGLNLPNEQTPDTPIVDSATWVNGRTGWSSGDIGTFLQAAIDGGAERIYIPYGNYTLSSTVVVRNNCKVIDFLFSEVSGSGSIRVDAGTSDTVWIENASLPVTVQLNSTRTMVLRHISNTTGGGGTKVTTGTGSPGGRIFLEDMGPKHTLTTTQPVYVWARQMDRENFDWSNLGGGAIIRLFGDNLEYHGDVSLPGDSDMIASGTDTRLEVIGGTFDAHDENGGTYPAAGKAAYTVNDGRMSVVMPSTQRSSTLRHWVADNRGGSRVGDVTDAQVVKMAARGQDARWIVPLYVSPP